MILQRVSMMLIKFSTFSVEVLLQGIKIILHYFENQLLYINFSIRTSTSKTPKIEFNINSIFTTSLLLALPVHNEQRVPHPTITYSREELISNSRENLIN